MTSFLLFLFFSAFAVEKSGVTLPDEVELSSKKLVLNGIGTREYSILYVFNLDVYVAGLYLEKKSQSEKSILRSPELKQVRMHFLRDVEATDIRDLWREYLKANHDGSWDTIAKPAERYLALYPDVKKDDVVVHDFLPTKVVLTVAGKKVGEIVDLNFPAVLLATWIGKKPTTEDLKSALLGKAH